MMRILLIVTLIVAIVNAQYGAAPVGGGAKRPSKSVSKAAVPKVVNVVQAEIQEVKAEEAALVAQSHGECKLPPKGDEKVCKQRSYDFCGPKTTSSFTTCREVFTRFCVNPAPVTDKESCLRARCDTLVGDRYHTAAQKIQACRSGDGRGGLQAQCQEQVCVRIVPETTTAPAATTAAETTAAATTTTADATTTAAQTTAATTAAQTTVLPTAAPQPTPTSTGKQAGTCRDIVELTAYALNIQCRLISLIQAVQGDESGRGLQTVVFAKTLDTDVKVVQQAQDKAVVTKAKSKSNKPAARKEDKAAVYDAIAKAIVHNVAVAKDKSKSRARKAKSSSRKGGRSRKYGGVKKGRSKGRSRRGKSRSHGRVRRGRGGYNGGRRGHGGVRRRRRGGYGGGRRRGGGGRGGGRRGGGYGGRVRVGGRGGGRRGGGYGGGARRGGGARVGGGGARRGGGYGGGARRGGGGGRRGGY